MRRLGLIRVVGLLAFLGWFAARAALACGAKPEGHPPDPPHRAGEAGLILSTGVIDFGKDHATAEVGVEYRLGADWCLGASPTLGGFVTADESFYVYAGIDRRIDIGPSWFVDSTFAVGFYEAGDGKDIGGSLEFRTGIAVGRRLRNGSRFGVGFFHMSNSSYYRRNPGVNSLLLRWSGAIPPMKAQRRWKAARKTTMEATLK